MIKRKPTFLDCPPRYTRTPRLDQSMAEYAAAVERVNTDYPGGWWSAVLCVSIIALVVIVATA